MLTWFSFVFVCVCVCIAFLICILNLIALFVIDCAVTEENL